jgi:mediator of RNA polymerase II transcription subunit 6
MSNDDDKSVLNRSFLDPIFLQQFALTRDNALEYFSRSPFYDPLSNNETLRMQGTNMGHLQRMTGVEFALDDRVGGGAGSRGSSTQEVDTGGRLFLVKKQKRASPSSVHVLAVYYILDGTVYQSPNLLHLMMTKYNKITSCLTAALSITTDCVDYTHSQSADATSIQTSAGGSRRVFPVAVPSHREGGDMSTEQVQAGKKRQKITDCRDFPSFNNCVNDMLTFVNK